MAFKITEAVFERLGWKPAVNLRFNYILCHNVTYEPGI